MSIPLDPRFIPAFSIEDVLLDKDTGAPLSGGQVFFFEDNQRSILKPVYQITGNSPNYTFIQLNDNPLTLSSIGTFQDSLGNPIIPYFFPYDSEGNPQLYYVAVYSSGGVLQFTREAVPYLGEVNDVSVLSIITNELSNPQFVEVNFNTVNSTYIYNFNNVTAQVVNIAPSWDIVVTAPSVATVTVGQLNPQGTLNIVTNPANILNINSAGVTKLLLRQRIYGSPNLWGNAFIAATFVGKTYNGLTTPVSMYYSQSNGSVMGELILTGNLPASGNYQRFNGSSPLIPISNSSDASPTAYIDIYFDIPPSIQIDITSVMVAYTGQLPIADMDYDQETPDRQKDHLFHYYEPQLKFKPIPSYLVGWDFPLNPAQPLGPTVNSQTLGANTSYYAWDQTVVFQAVDNSINISRVANIGFLQLSARVTTQMALIQYLSAAQMQEILVQAFTGLSSSVRMSSTVAQTMSVSLWWTAGAIPALSGNASLVTGLDANGHPSSVVAGWTEIKIPFNNGLFKTFGSFTVQDFAIPGFMDKAAYSTAANFAIVVGSSLVASGNVLNFGSISLVPGLIATIPAPKTYDQTLRECQYYYEKSYAPAQIPGANSFLNAETCYMNSTVTQSSANTAKAYASPFQFKFNTIKRAVPNITLYSTDGTSNAVRSHLYYLVSGVMNDINGNTTPGNYWGSTGDLKTVFFVPNNNSNQYIITDPGVPGSNYSSAAIIFQWTADARYGVV